MSDDDGGALKARADERLERALRERGARDPRPGYRDRLRALKHEDSAAFEQALRYFEETLVPAVADESNDPITCWLEYGVLLAELGGPGRTVEIDATGRAVPREGAAALDRMLLRLPDGKRSPAFPINLPPDPTPPQQATYRLLVERKLR
ncbi:MAG: hypothetical protein ACOC8B_00355 [Gemmatimonadota bacterium]